VDKRWINGLLLGLVLLVHGGALAAYALWSDQPPAPATQPTLNGVLIQAPAAKLAPPAASPEPVANPEPVAAQAKPQPLRTPKPAVKPSAKPLPQPVAKPIATAVKPVPAQPASAQPTPASTPPATIATAAAPSSTPAASTAPGGAPVTQPRIDHQYRRNTQPTYPRLSRRRGEEGTVLLQLMVRKDGSVAQVRIKQSSGYPRLDQAALEAVRGWKYNPATRDGKAIDYPYLQPVTFSLNG